MEELERGWRALEKLFGKLDERVCVIEENTCNHESRLEDLEKWQEKVDDQIDGY
jgi:hypothetical protein